MSSCSVTSDHTFYLRKKLKPQRITNCNKKKHLENSTLENSRCFCISKYFKYLRAKNYLRS